MVAPGAARIVHRDGPVQAFAALRQADFQEHIPDALHLQAFMRFQFLHAGGTAGNDDRPHTAPELLQLPVDKLFDRVIQLVAPRPVADCSAAAEHQGDTARQPAAQVRPGRAHGFRRDRTGLAAREEDISAGLITRLCPGQESLAIGEQHIQQREFVRGERHFVGGNARVCSVIVEEFNGSHPSANRGIIVLVVPSAHFCVVNKLITARGSFRRHKVRRAGLLFTALKIVTLKNLEFFHTVPVGAQHKLIVAVSAVCADSRGIVVNQHFALGFGLVKHCVFRGIFNRDILLRHCEADLSLESRRGLNPKNRTAPEYGGGGDTLPGQIQTG